MFLCDLRLRNDLLQSHNDLKTGNRIQQVVLEGCFDEITARTFYPNYCKHMGIVPYSHTIEDHGPCFIMHILRQSLHLDSITSRR